MANLQNDYPDDPPQPIDPTLPQPATSGRPKSAADAQHNHFKSLVQHTLDMSDYNNHGHAPGRQGKAGHRMPPNDAHKQAGSYLPQNVQNTWSDGAGCATANQPGTDDYGKVDNGK
jgi:hypothetical protein